jgi:hypothetical protein
MCEPEVTGIAAANGSGQELAAAAAAVADIL